MANPNLSDSNHPASETALALTAWWRSQRQWASKGAAAKALGIPQSTFKDYFYGAEPSRPNKAKLYEATGLPIFADEAKPPQRSNEDDKAARQADAKLAEVSTTLRTLSDQFATLYEVLDQLKATKGPAEVLRFPTTGPAEKRVEATVQLLYRLMAALESFRSSPSDRKVLRQRLHGPDIGYLYSLANALLDEEKFETWKEISSYRPLGARR